MRFRAIACLPLVFTAGLTLAAVFAPDPGTRDLILRLGSEGVKVLGFTGCALAALAFDRGDYLRRAWALNGACFLLLLARDVTLRPLFGVDATVVFGAHVLLAQGLLVTLANTSSAVGTWLMARAWRVAGLEPSGSALPRRAVLAAAVGSAVAITAGPFLLDLRALLGGDLEAVVALASDLGDVLSLCFIAPVLWTALAMRGGLLRWPWALFTGSLLCWLAYDATAPLARLAGIDPSALLLVREALRALACTLTFAAGLSQRAAVRAAG